MEEEDLYKLCSPSYWSKRFSLPDEVIQYHLKFINENSAAIRNKIPSHLDIPYGASEKEKIDIFGTNLANDSPILIFIHGGYWQEKAITRASYHFISENLHKHNIKTIFIGYDLCPDVTIPQVIKQIENATKTILQYAKEMNSRGMYFAGHSAGAHLVVSLFANFIKSLSQEEQVLIKGAFLLSGVFDLTPLQKTAINDLLKLNARMAFDLSPLNWTIQDSRSRFCTIVGENESGLFVEQSRDFSRKLVKMGLLSELVIVENVDHFDIVEKLIDGEYKVTQLIINIINTKAMYT